MAFEIVVEHSRLVKFFGLGGLALWPFIFLDGAKLGPHGKPTVTLQHERIHHKQQLEYGILLFYVLYLLEHAWRIFVHGYDRAYWHISFEREAHANEKRAGYLEKRTRFAHRYYFPNDGGSRAVEYEQSLGYKTTRCAGYMPDSTEADGDNPLPESALELVPAPPPLVVPPPPWSSSSSASSSSGHLVATSSPPSSVQRRPRSGSATGRRQR
jgi:hypothetical protein